MKLFTTTGNLLANLKGNKLTRFDYDEFTITERGKKREIAAPRVYDRQVDKAVSKEILLPIYEKHMIYDNGASMKGKGFHFSMKRLKQDLIKHYKKYGRERGILLIDFKDYFGSSDHEVIKKHHEKYFPDEQVRDILWNSVEPNFKTKGFQPKKGLPLGVETSQAEMVHYPSLLDKYIQCQLRLGLSGHYMDDYRVIIPPDRDWKEILNKIEEKAASMGITLSRHKTKYVPLTKSFRFCKIQFRLLENEKVLTKGNKKSSQIIRRKIRMFKREIDARNKTYMDMLTCITTSLGYFDNRNDSWRKGKLAHLFKKTFGFDYNDIFMYHLKDFEKENPEKGQEIKEIIGVRGCNENAYICAFPYSGEDMFGEVVIIKRRALLDVRGGLLIYKNHPVCTTYSEACHNHFFDNSNGTGIEKGELIQKIKQQMEYTVGQRLFSRHKQWEEAHKVKECLFLKSPNSPEGDWKWNRMLYDVEPDYLRKVLKVIERKIYNPNIF